MLPQHILRFYYYNVCTYKFPASQIRTGTLLDTSVNDLGVSRFVPVQYDIVTPQHLAPTGNQ